jgi:hypothetical protein
MKTSNSTTNLQNLKKVKTNLLIKAKQRHGNIVPCGNWKQCFTLEDDTLLFWYTTPKDQSTHLVSQKI